MSEEPRCIDIANGLGHDQAKTMGIPLSDELFSSFQERMAKNKQNKRAGGSVRLERTLQKKNMNELSQKSKDIIKKYQIVIRGFENLSNSQQEELLDIIDKRIKESE